MNAEQHRAVRELLGAYALDHLDAAERTAVQAHLDGCAECRAELAAIAPLAGPLRTADPDRVTATPAAPPAALEHAILTAIDRAAGSERSSGRRRNRTWAVAAAAALIVGGAGAGLGYGLAPRPPSIPLEPVAVATAASGIQSTAAVVPHTWGMEIKLTATGFGAGRRYRVVVITDTGRSAPAGEFIGTGSTQMNCNLNSSVLRGQATQFRVLDDRGGTVLTAAI